MGLTQYSRRSKLTDSMLSKAVLGPISGGYAPPDVLVQHLGIQSEVGQLAGLYKAKKGASAGNDPKYLPFYHVIGSKFPDFCWDIQYQGAKPQVLFDKPFINFIRPSLLTLLICAIRGNLRTTPELKVKYSSMRGLPDELVSELGKTLKDLSFFLPGEDYVAEVAETLLKGLEGEEITLISPVCPDYGYEKHGSRFRYTFDHLSDGIGLVASRIVRTLPRIQDVLASHGIRSNIVVAAGDFEGFEEATLNRVRESRQSFREKIENSQLKILKSIERGAKSEFISQLAGGEHGWEELTQRAYNSICGGDFGGLLQTDIDMNGILEARMPLYRAWRGNVPKTDLEDVLIRQCAEYAAMGLLFKQQFKNPIVIGGDHKRMMPFYWLYGRVPVLYLKQIY